jgi:uncharacterized protein (TIGR02217 family)
MAILMQQLSDAVARKSRGGPTQPARRQVFGADGWLRKQNFVSLTRPHRYDISYGIRRKRDFEEVLAAYHVVMGAPYEGFLFRDWNDYQASATNSALQSLGGGQYQLQRKYTFGSSVYRDISKPEVPTVAVYSAGGSALSITEVDAETGIVTLAAGTPAYWTGRFFVPVTFADDSMENIEIDGYEGADGELQGLPSIKLVEVLA